MPDFVLALDQGTTSSRAILFDHSGGIHASAQLEFGQIYPRPGWVEHDPEEIWTSQLAVAREAISRGGISPTDIAAVGITNQRETTVLWDRETGQPVHNAIVWQDRRTARHVEALKERGLEERFRATTGLVLDPYFSATKIAWLLDNVPGARERAESGKLAFGTVDSWLAYRLTGGTAHVTDASNASRTLLFDIRRGRWSEELLELLEIPVSLLPEVRPSSSVFGECAAGLLGAAVPIAGIAGDQQAATFGQACYEPGQGKSTYGTGCFVVLNTGEEAVASANRLLTTVAWEVEGTVEYALEGSIFIAGAVVQWLRDELGIIGSSEQVESLARSVGDSGGVVLVPAFTGLGAPHWDPYARGTIVGLTRGSKAGHIARAALESIGFQVADVIQAMEADSGTPLRELRVDGGASRNDLLLQFQADLLGVPVVRPEITETTSLGAAYLAGLAVGFWEDRQELAEQWREGARFEPAMSEDRRQALLHDWHRAVGRSRGWAEE